MGVDLYIVPSDMDLYIGTIIGYNDLIVISSLSDIENVQLGQNNVNNAPVIPQEIFETPPDDFSFEDEPVIPQEAFETPPDDFRFEDEPVYEPVIP